MANTYTQLYIQLVFAVKGRANLLSPFAQEKVHHYIIGILKEQEQKPLATNGMADHIHIFFGLNPTHSISNLVRDIKTGATNFINQENLVANKFSWQEGYGAFSYGNSQKQQVIDYVIKQKEHHAKQTFRQEYLGLLKKFDIPFEEKYAFEFIEL